MIAEQLIHPSSKLGTTRLWHTTTLAQELGVVDADEDDLYAAMDWLIQRQSRIEKKLASRCLGAQLAISVHNCPVLADTRFPMSIFKRTQRKYVKKACRRAADSAIATLQHKLGSANESGTQNRATANGAKSRQRSIATRLSWAQRGVVARPGANR